jgi:hypothetical protein
MLSDQAVRNWCVPLVALAVVAFMLIHTHLFLFLHRKLVTAIFTAGVAVHSTLYADYEMPPHLQGEKHVFSDLQQWYRTCVDTHVWKLPPIQQYQTNHPIDGSNTVKTTQEQKKNTTAQQESTDP